MAATLRRQNDPPMTRTPQDINERQNEPEFVSLLCAADAAHHQAQQWETLRWIAVSVTAILALVAASHPSLQRAMSITGVIAAILITLVIPIPSTRRTALAALIQESFDTRLFHLHANALVGRTPLGEGVDDLALKFDGDVGKKRDWYLDVRGLSWPYAILLCQRELGVGLSPAKGMGALGVGRDPCLGCHRDRHRPRARLERARAVSTLVRTIGCADRRWLPGGAKPPTDRTRERGSCSVRGVRLAAAPAGEPDPATAQELTTYIRQLQDKITDSRKKTARVPPWFYERRREREELLHLTNGLRLRDRLLAPVEE